MVRYVYDFTEGGRDMADFLGGKGANLAGMTRLGLPAPPGFTLTTEACRAFLERAANPRTCGWRSPHTCRPWKPPPAVGWGSRTTRCC